MGNMNLGDNVKVCYLLWTFEVDGENFLILVPFLTMYILIVCFLLLQHALGRNVVVA